ncbi:MAG: hypothetical protein AABX38_05210 [Candidatus Micrarchaeota archaeon]
MSATAVQVNNRNRYERTRELSRMLTSGSIAEAIIKEVKRKFAEQPLETNIFDVLPVKAATSMRYDKGARTATAWNDGGKEERIDLPLEGGWRISDGNPFGVPNGKPSNHDDPNALYLILSETVNFSGPIGLGFSWGGRVGKRNFFADGSWWDDSGMALVNLASSVFGLEALSSIKDPQKLRENAAQLRQTAESLRKILGSDERAAIEIIKPILDKAAKFDQLADELEGIKR